MNHREDAFQMAVLKLLALAYPLAIPFHVPNGGKRNAREAGRLKGLGVLAGMMDLGIIRPHGRIAWLELKAPGGTLSKSQQALHPRVRALGHAVHVIWDIDQLVLLIAQWKQEDAHA